MKVKTKGVIIGLSNEVMNSATLVIANDWRLDVMNHTLSEYLSLPTLEIESDVITQNALDMGSDGIIFGGLDWSLQPLELVELVSSAVDRGLKILIMTVLSLEEFDKLIGTSTIGKVGYEKLYTDLATLGTEEEDIYLFIGRTILDYLIEDEYYMLCGIDDPQFYVFKPSEEEGGRYEFTEKTI